MTVTTDLRIGGALDSPLKNVGHFDSMRMHIRRRGYSKSCLKLDAWMTSSRGFLQEDLLVWERFTIILPAKWSVVFVFVISVSHFELASSGDDTRGVIFRVHAMVVCSSCFLINFHGCHIVQRRLNDRSRSMVICALWWCTVGMRYSKYFCIFLSQFQW